MKFRQFILIFALFLLALPFVYSEATEISCWTMDSINMSDGNLSSANTSNKMVIKGNPSNLSGTNCKIGGCMDFDGVDDELESAGVFGVTGASARTITLWVKADTDGNTGASQWIFSTGTLGACNTYGVYVSSTANLLRQGGWGACDWSWGITNPREWTFLEISYDGTATTIFINGTNTTRTVETLNTGSSVIRIAERIEEADPNQEFDGKIDEVKTWNGVLTAAQRTSESAGVSCNGTIASTPPDATPPEINQGSYNMTSEGGEGCLKWRTDKTDPCSTGDTTPTVNFTTNKNAWCAIGTQNINFSDYNNLGINRNCTTGQGATSHTCTLVNQDELVYEDSTVYLSCEDTNKNQNITSTSGALSLRITGLEASGDSAIGSGVQNALLSGYTNYTTQQIFARKLDNTQDFGTFDWVAKKGSRVWAFNYITKGEEHVQLFNLTPALYVLEMSNITATNITKKVEALINGD